MTIYCVYSLSNNSLAICDDVPAPVDGASFRMFDRDMPDLSREC